MKLVMLGIISGIVTGLGMGGGSILIILLTAFLGVDQHLAQATNLFFFIPTAIISIIVHFKNKNVDASVGKSILLPVVVGSAAGAILTLQLQPQKLKKYFGIFLLLIMRIDSPNTSPVINTYSYIKRLLYTSLLLRAS